MTQATEVIRKVAQETDRAVLFHSASGKDSIALLDLLHPHFKEIVCAFMYQVPNLEHIDRYITWATNKYSNARFVKIPHYSLCSYIKNGFLGCRQNVNQRLYTLENLTDIVRERTGIEWTFFGFKQSDSMNRRIMLRTYEDEAIKRSTHKAYPLSRYKNADVLHYIETHNLIKPESYDNKHQSAGVDVTDVNYLLYLRSNFPRDLERIYKSFPMAERLLFDYDNAVRDGRQ